jgi:hypothetical protein
MTVRNVLNKQILDDLSGIAVESLAPSLGSIVYGYLTGTSRHPYVNPDYFMKITYLTNNFEQILRDIFIALNNGGTYATMLNFDMGTGKTHLMTLIFHLFSTIPNKYDTLRISMPAKLERLRILGYNIDITKRTAVLAIDLRHPSLRDLIEAFKKSLESTGDGVAAQYIAERIKKSTEDEIFYNLSARELAEKINGRTNIIILLDELFYGVFHTREAMKGILKFVTDFVSARRKYSDNKLSAIILLVATARSDFERWTIEKSDLEKIARELVHQVESFLEQLSRILTHSNTQWLNTEEALKIIYARLDRDYDPKNPYPFTFHFKEFVERIMKADSDIPQAQHLRSLIKAMAIFAKTAYEENSPWVTPAHFNEDIISVLFPTADQLALQYRSAFDQAIMYARGKNNKALEYSIRAIFTSSIVGDARKLLEAIIAAKGGTEAKVPSADEKYIESVLKFLEFKDEDIANAIRLLDETPNILTISARGVPKYFISPGENLYAIYIKLIEQRKKELFEPRIEVAKEIIRSLPSIAIPDSWFEIRVEKSLPSKIERIDNNKLYLYIITDAINQDETKKWLIDNKKYNLVVALPELSEEILNLIIEYKSIYDSTQEFLEEYLSVHQMLKIEMKENMADLVDKYKKALIDVMMHRIRDKLGEAYNLLNHALTNMLSKVYWYSPKGIAEPLNIFLKEKKFEKPYIHYEKAKESIKDASDKRIRSFIEDYMSQLARLINFYHTYKNELTDTIEEYVVKRIKEQGEIELSPDMNVLELESSQYFIITPNVLKSVIKTLSDRLKSNKDIQVSITDDVLRVKRREEQPPPQPPLPPPITPPPPVTPPVEAIRFQNAKEWREWLFNQINNNNVESIQVNLNIEKINLKDIASITSIKIKLGSIMDYVKESTVKTKDGKSIKCVIGTTNQK